MSDRPLSSDLGIRVYGLAAIVFGISGIAYRDFATVWQPVPPGVPNRTALALVSAACLLAGGIAVQSRRSARIGLSLTAIPYLAFALLWSRRIIGYPHISATWSGTAEELVLVIAAMVAFASLTPREGTSTERAVRIGRVAFGLCVVSFGATHFEALTQTAQMVPAWLPPGQRFWAIATGIGFVLAGLSLVSGVRALLACRMLVVMFLGIGALVWLPAIVARPHEHLTWGGNAIHLAVTGAAWMMADALASRAAPRRARASSA